MPKEVDSMTALPTGDIVHVRAEDRATDTPEGWVWLLFLGFSYLPCY